MIASDLGPGESLGLLLLWVLGVGLLFAGAILLSGRWFK